MIHVVGPPGKHDQLCHSSQPQPADVLEANMILLCKHPEQPIPMPEYTLIMKRPELSRSVNLEMRTAIILRVPFNR